MTQIDSKLIENISENLIGILPVIHRKLINILDEGIELELSHYHFAILGMLSKFNDLSVSEIGRRLLISKPQMTAILDKLVDFGLVSRSQRPEDRRIVYISLTPQGEQFLARALETLNNNMAVKLANLSEADLLSFAAALKTIKEVGAKIE
jgi:MarR family transcriptional regulator, organic hydroperoxide resistance regulator